MLQSRRNMRRHRRLTEHGMERHSHATDRDRSARIRMCEHSSSFDLRSRLMRFLRQERFLVLLMPSKKAWNPQETANAALVFTRMEYCMERRIDAPA